MEIDYRRFGITFTPSDLEALLQDHYTFFTKVPVCVCKIWARFSHGEKYMVHTRVKHLVLQWPRVLTRQIAHCTQLTKRNSAGEVWAMSRNRPRPRGAIKIPDRTGWPGLPQCRASLTDIFYKLLYCYVYNTLFFLGSVVCLVFYFIFFWGGGGLRGVINSYANRTKMKTLENFM